ncbi:GNAT family N-acetyltransferase [Pedobacter frigoris]|uniref:GNAT family N-acetyltransferase n=1 Tax=Pedobacter frigoris TaxID=2571272 RepID=A0A4U1CFL7_9SPHI|nr:GNAT family N-acetyltransferase [Pedobacter frigoris]TKC03690.1 GNAT family N-acetyltransferase [Pedobacter frigoris]
MSYRSRIVRNKMEWIRYIERALMYEAYHTWHYHSLNTEGEPLLFVFELAHVFVALPLIKRGIPDTNYFDLTSVYGYAGPVSNVDLSQLDALTVERFKSEFIDFMNEEKCVCVFSRLHPFLNQQVLLGPIGGVRDNGNTIYMDLKRSVDEQIANYHPRLARQIRHLRHAGLVIKEASDKTEIGIFTDMYNENMSRLHASSNYYFTEDYFEGLLNSTEFSAKLILIYKGIEITSGAIIFLSEHIIRNHLSATATEYLGDSPSKLLTDEISCMGRSTDAGIFHLGGGVGGKEDSLFQFKSYFSEQRKQDCIWCYVNNQHVYNELTFQVKGGVDSSPNFFPAYRRSTAKEVIKSV